MAAATVSISGKLKKHIRYSGYLGTAARWKAEVGGVLTVTWKSAFGVVKIENRGGCFGKLGSKANPYVITKRTSWDEHSLLIWLTGFRSF